MTRVAFHNRRITDVAHPHVTDEFDPAGSSVRAQVGAIHTAHLAPQTAPPQAVDSA